MRKTDIKQCVPNCIRNCWDTDKCKTCQNFKSVVEGNKEIEMAQELFYALKLY